jgi:diguanylate cyclase (GGDEF)-like protein/PAS domain S-box-containing protein
MIYTPGLSLFILASVMIALLLVFSWQYRNTESGRYFFLLMGSALIWVFFFVFETAATTLSWKLIFAIIEFLGIVFIPVFWLFLIISFTGQSVSSQLKPILYILPVLSTLVLWTNPLHHWFMGQPSIVTSGVPFPVLDTDYQFWFYFIHAPGSYIYIAVSLFILLRYLVHAEPVYKVQIRMLLMAILLPYITDLLYVFGFSPVKHYNFTTAVFSISGVILFWILFRFRFLDLLPLARDMVIDNLDDGFLVIDHKHRLVYLNPSAKTDFNLSSEQIGQTIEEIQNEYLQQIKTMLDENVAHRDVNTDNADGKFYDIHLSPVFNAAKLQIGYVATTHDVTERVKLFNQVHTLSIQDSLTGVFNRRHYLSVCSRELDRIKQKGSRKQAAVVMIDLDSFKQINDTYGHAVGDKMLMLFSDSILSTLRRYDFFGRMGGDEFSLFIMDVEINESLEIIERVRKTINIIQLQQDDQVVSITASFGVVHTSQVKPAELEIETMLQLADQALYQGKETGKNYIQLYQRTVA